MTDIDMMPQLLENFALEWEADIRFNKMSDGSEPGPEVKIRPREQCDRVTAERRIAFMREVAAEIIRLRAIVDKWDDEMNGAPAPPVEGTTDLRSFGYAPGNYTCKCQKCDGEFVGDKRASTCEDCASAALTAIGARDE